VRRGHGGARRPPVARQRARARERARAAGDPLRGPFGRTGRPRGRTGADPVARHRRRDAGGPRAPGGRSDRARPRRCRWQRHPRRAAARPGAHHPAPPPRAAVRARRFSPMRSGRCPRTGGGAARSA
jgi:hypothetical protein